MRPVICDAVPLPDRRVWTTVTFQRLTVDPAYGWLPGALHVAREPFRRT
jgi:hypothetical protein